MGSKGHQRNAERDIEAGLKMIRFLIGLSPREFEKYKLHKLHLVPRNSWNRLSEEEKERAFEMGIETRSDDYNTHTGKPVDEMPISAGSVQVSEDDESKEIASTPAHNMSSDERTWFVVRQVVDIIISSPNARLEAECFRLASGLGGFDNITESNIARKHGVTRAAVSKRCVRLTKILGIRPSQFMRPLEMREKYRKSRKKSLQMKNQKQKPCRS